MEVTPRADESERDAAVDGERANGSPNHPPLDDGYGGVEAFESCISEPERKQDKDEGVGERSERAGAMIAVGFFAIGRPFGPSHREIGNAEHGDVITIATRVPHKADPPPHNAS